MGQTYYAVIFSSQRNSNDQYGYEKIAERMIELARQQNGFVGVESARDSDGVGITVSYWKSKEDIRNWKAHSDHQLAQEFGRSDGYSSYKTRICVVEREYEFIAECRTV